MKIGAPTAAENRGYRVRADLLGCFFTHYCAYPKKGYVIQHPLFEIFKNKYLRLKLSIIKLPRKGSFLSSHTREKGPKYCKQKSVLRVNFG